MRYGRAAAESVDERGTRFGTLLQGATFVCTHCLGQATPRFEEKRTSRTRIEPITRG
jgi:hypothetical protein